LRRRIKYFQHLKGGFEVLAGRRKGPENIFVPAAEYFIGSAAAFDHGNLVALGDNPVRDRNPAGIRAQQEIDLVFGNELFDKFGAFRRIAFNVIVNKF
jgi:hypothetical protein